MGLSPARTACLLPISFLSPSLPLTPLGQSTVHATTAPAAIRRFVTHRVMSVRCLLLLLLLLLGQGRPTRCDNGPWQHLAMRRWHWLNAWLRWRFGFRRGRFGGHGGKTVPDESAKMSEPHVCLDSHVVPPRTVVRRSHAHDCARASGVASADGRLGRTWRRAGTRLRET
jgi:hypothetical protein